MLYELFGTDRPVIGVIHLLPLPGSPRYGGDLEPVLLRAEQEATALASGGAHGIIIENFFDAPFDRLFPDLILKVFVGKQSTVLRFVRLE